jgi:hypothetical protein
MKKTRDDILWQITDNLDHRRLEITNLRRIVLNHAGKPLENTVVRMSVPMIYAHWEGYVKETCQLYLEHIEASLSRVRQLQPALLGYLWTPKLKPITGGLNFERRKIVAECALLDVLRPIRFGDAEKAINTQSNLNFPALEGIAKDLCLDISSLAPWRRYLDAFVQMRNNIAHGASPRMLSRLDFEEHAESVIGLMEGFEHVLLDAIRNANFCRPRSRPRRARYGDGDAARNE